MDDYYYPSDEWSEPEPPDADLRPRSLEGRLESEWSAPEPSDYDYLRGREYRPRSYTRSIRPRSRAGSQGIYSNESDSSSEGALTVEEVEARVVEEAYLDYLRKLPQMERIKKYLLWLFAVAAVTLMYIDWNRRGSNSDDSWSSTSAYYRGPKKTGTDSKQRDPYYYDNPYDLHYTRNLGHFWEHYRMIMAPNRDYGYWFDDATESMNIIRIMWGGVAPATTPEAAAVHRHYEELMELRAEEIRLARVEWEKFLDTRTRLLLHLLDDKSPWRVYVNESTAMKKKNNSTNNNAEEGGARNWTEDIAHEFLSGATTPPKIVEHEEFNLTRLQEGEEGHGDGGEEVLNTHVNNETYLALENAARMVTREIVEGHALLFRDMPAVLEHLGKARKAEDEFIKDVLDHTWKRDLWTLEYARGLLRAHAWVGKLMKLGERMEVPVKWLEDRFPISDGGTALLEKETKTLEWMKTAEELLRVWGAVLMDLQEGLLITIRHDDVAHDMTLKAGNSSTEVDYDASWDAWKKRNCGGTYCYDPASPFGGLKEVLIGVKTAKVASDEANWSKEKYGEQKRRIWRGIYQKACCENSELAMLLRNGTGSSQVDEHDLDLE
jgi:hypothetical protein